MTGLEKHIPAEFTATHSHTDARGSTLIACDMKSAAVFIVDASSQDRQIVFEPIKQLESVAVVEHGESRVSELRLDIALADERRTLVKVHVLQSPASRKSEQYAQAQALAAKWATRLSGEIEDPTALLAALSADESPAVYEQTGSRWQLPAAGALAGISALSLAAAMMSQPDKQSPDRSMAQAPSVSTSAAANTPAAAPTIAAANVEKVDLKAELNPLEARIDDVSERSLMQGSRISTEALINAISDVETITTELDDIEARVSSKKDLRRVADIRTYLVSTQQDVLPRYRRLYSSTLEKDGDVSVSASTGGYASRELSLTHEQFLDDDFRAEFLDAIRADIARLRFDTVTFHSGVDNVLIDSMDLDGDSDAMLHSSLRGFD